jgi:hypothetical protein
MRKRESFFERSRHIHLDEGTKRCDIERGLRVGKDVSRLWRKRRVQLDYSWQDHADSSICLHRKESG